MKNKIFSFSILVLLPVLILALSDTSSSKTELSGVLATVPVTVTLDGSGSDDAVVIATDTYSQEVIPFKDQGDNIHTADLNLGHGYWIRACSNNTQKSGNVVYTYIEKGQDNVLHITVMPQVCLD